MIWSVFPGAGEGVYSDNAEYKATMNAKFTLVVMDPNALDATFNFASYGWANQKEISTVTEGVVTLLFDKKENSNTPKYFEKDNDVRLYGGGSLTISVPEAYYLTKVESEYKNTTNDLTPSYGSFNSNFTLWTAEGMESSVEFTESGTSGNRSWTSIKVYFEQRPTEIVDFTHDGIVSKAHVASLKYTLHVANHKDDSMYTVTLTLKDVNGDEVVAENEEHSLVEAPVAMAPARAAAATHRLSGSVGFNDLTPEMTYTPTVSYGLKGAEPTGAVELPAFTMLTTGIEDVTVDGNEAAEYFNLQGVRVAQPEAGHIYIVRRGAKVAKELVK